ncbi:hypothetical protein F7Q99_20330 [Streptomyces kaniharaensis]|uniref:Uncharacterized protein n=2 Tax=Streptomyces kaniharaensis TaxID=212423 RepID=A0A6N7KW53_9ACTN|nr:hypothetical protein [Streptomyces kaniharaensis]
MSTVVGISIATTLLLHEQQGIGRRAGVARVGTTPPPTPTGGEQADASADRAPTAPPTTAATAPATTPATGGRPSAARSAAPLSGTASPGASGSRKPTPGPTGTPSAGNEPGTHDGGLASTDDPSAQAHGPAAAQQQPVPQQPAQPCEQPSPSPHANRPSLGTPLAPTLPSGPSVPPAPTPATAPGAGAAGTTDTPDTGGDHEADQVLTGTALVTPLGPDGTRHVLGLGVTEPVTALQAEFRLTAGELAPGSGTAWTDLPGAVVTAHQERGTLVYRFTTPAGTDVRPGHYTFAVRGTRPAVPAGAVTVTGARKPAAAESWNAAAFGLTHPRAVAALGSFATADAHQTAPQPATAQQPAPRPGALKPPAAR